MHAKEGHAVHGKHTASGLPPQTSSILSDSVVEGESMLGPWGRCLGERRPLRPPGTSEQCTYVYVHVSLMIMPFPSDNWRQHWALGLIAK